MKYLLLFLLSLSANAAIICVGPTSSGSGTGADWNNLAQWSSTTPARGNTYYLADGTYGGKTLSAAGSGSTYIYIYKAVTNDSAVTSIDGWTDSLGDGQATFSGQINITTGHYVFSGVRSVLWSQTTTDYGFTSTLTFPLHVGSESISISNITISCYSAVATTSDVEKYFAYSGDSTRHIGNFTLSRCYGKNYANFIKGTGGASHGQRVRDTWITEYNAIIDTHSSAGVHGEAINNGYGYMQNWHIRYNYISGIANQPPTGCIVVLNDDSGPYLIYGNVIDSYTWAEVGIGGIHHAMSGVVYNNTLIANDTPYSYNEWIGGGGAGTTSTCRNNLIVLQEADHGGSGTTSHNTYADCTEVPVGENNSQTMADSPLVSTSNFHLATDTADGFDLSSPYNQDPDGVTRGTGGNWSRGAFQFVTDVDPSSLSGKFVLQGKLVLGL